MHYAQKAIDWDALPLGQVPDSVLAREVGVAAQVAWKARVRRGIPAFVSQATQSLGTVAWDTIGLGRKPDRAIAAQLGINERRVCYQRRKRGIGPFVGLVLTQEGMPCRSVYEAMYDAYLHDREIAHEHEVRVPGLPFVADFQIGERFVEVVGMNGFKRYDEKHERKRRAYEKSEITVCWVNAEEVVELFRSCSVSLRVRNRCCADCGAKTHDLVKRVCRKCYMRRWHRANTEPKACEACSQTFGASRNQRFCSRDCYWKSLELDWPSWPELDRRLKERPIRQVAFDLGVQPSTLYMRLRRRRQRAVRRFTIT